MVIWRHYRDASLILKITIALVLGVLVGIIFGKDAAYVLAPFGELLLRLLQFLIIPLILFTLISGMNQTDIKDLGRMGGKVSLYYIFSTGFAIVVGIAVATILKPGSGMSLAGEKAVETPDNPGVIHALLNIVPDNIISAFTELNLLGIIFTAIVFGIAISSLRSSEKFSEAGEMILTVFEGLNEATLRIMRGVLLYLPIGVFAIVAKTIGENGLGTLFSLGEMVVVLYVALIIQIGLYIVAMLITGVSPIQFFKQARVPMLTAFVTQSSSGTLPLTLEAARKLNIKKSLYGFSLPFGATVNMDGAAIRIAVSAVFAANIMGDPLQISQMIQIVLIGTLISIGTAGIPGAGIVMIAIVFAQVGLPMEAVGLLTAIDVLVGMGATCLNVTGDLVGTSIIDRTEKKRARTLEKQAN